MLGNNDNPKMLMGAAFKECKDSPQRSRVHKAPRPQADIYQPWETVGVGARLRATRQMLPADRTRALRLSWRGVLPLKNVRIHRRDTECAKGALFTSSAKTSSSPVFYI
ncbi:MAG TPA: hypothetical protein DIW77_14345 [Chromatiaceae bacterium]|nr:hypothetical protein [Chromatiaceae bacterium]